uniref:mevalonate kinase n=1 Tax=Promineifilum sp. TaxID=2664178 RepID=UPI0035B11FCD
PGKVILFGEHAVVYGRPAVAAPVTQLRARATIEELPGPDVRMVTPDLGREMWLSAARQDNPLAVTVRAVQRHFSCQGVGGFSLSVTSEIPIASGLGSGAAIAVAVIRALALYFGRADTLSRDDVSRLAYEVERLHHGTPSGIDNTVIAFEQPVYFVRAQPQNRIETFTPARPLRLLIGDTGVRSATKIVVDDVRRRWERDPARFERIFDACGRLADAGRVALARGDLAAVGELMSENHDWLARMTVSSTTLNRLVDAALSAGALGAKLSGAGRGGNMIALVSGETEQAVAAALRAAGAVRMFSSDVG